ncbi:unnamed protein product [Cochlearia groenlandica]
MLSRNRTPIYSTRGRGECYGDGLEFEKEDFEKVNYAQGYEQRGYPSDYLEKGFHKRNQPQSSDQGYYQHQGHPPPRSQPEKTPTPSREEENTNLINKILEGQEKAAMILDMKLEAVNKKVDGFYTELNAKFEQLSRKVDNTHLPNSKGKESCKAITLRSGKELPSCTKKTDKVILNSVKYSNINSNSSNIVVNAGHSEGLCKIAIKVVLSVSNV